MKIVRGKLWIWLEGKWMGIQTYNYGLLWYAKRYPICLTKDFKEEST